MVPFSPLTVFVKIVTENCQYNAVACTHKFLFCIAQRDNIGLKGLYEKFWNAYRCDWRCRNENNQGTSVPIMASWDVFNRDERCKCAVDG